MTFLTTFRRAALGFGLALMAVLPAAADPIATVLAIRGQAQGPGGPIEAGDRISDGVVIRTNGNTQVELRFDDGTLMAVGPNSELEVTSVLMNSDGQASRFAINATAGSFRFLSGDSADDAYEITTPAATIGIRGTEFDVAVFEQSTGLALFRGRLEMCLSDGSKCWAFRGSCYVAEADISRNRVRGLRPNEARGYLPNFPYVQSQRRLLPELQTVTTACNKYQRDDDGGSGGISCEFDGEGLLCYDPETGEYFYSF